MKVEELVADLSREVEQYKEFHDGGERGKLGYFAKASDWDQLLADARLAAQLRKFVEEHGELLRELAWVGEDESPHEDEDRALAAVRAYEELLAVARGEKT